MQKASSQESSYDYQKYQNFVLKTFIAFTNMGSFRHLTSVPSQVITELTEKEEVGAPAVGSVPAEVKERP